MVDFSIKIIKALPGEAADVAEIGRTTFYETWRDVNTEEDMQLYMNSSFDLNKIRKEVSDTGTNVYLLARNENTILGYAKLRRDRTNDEFKNAKAIELERIYVKKEFQKMKIGKKLMDQCIQIAKAEQHQWLWLAVNTENFTAIDFYKKYGFQIFGTKFFQLGNAKDEDYLMKLNLMS